jgi:DNA-binding SARP family transcriptional activator
LSVDGRRVDVGGPKPRALLALLALERGEAVTRDRLIEALWGDAPPGGVAHRLDVQMSRLRAVLRATDGAARVERENGGYVLRAEGVWVDAIEAQRLVADARRLLALGAAAQAHAAAEEALGLWRGRPLSELSDDPASQAIARRLEDLRLAALEARAEASLELGRHQSVLGELQLLAAEHPMHEPFHALLMLALQRCGREADALRAYDELQGRLREELGAVPGQSVRRVHEAILAPEPARTFEPPTKPAPQVRTSGRRVLIGAAAAAVALLALAAVHGERGPAAHVGGRITARVGADRVAFIDLRHGRVLDSFSIADLGPDDNDLPWIQGGDADWLASSNGTLLKIDPRRHRVARAVGLGIAANTMTLGLGSLWITDKDHPTILRLDPQYAEVQRRYRLPTIGGPAGDGLSAVAIAQGSVWVAQGRRRVLRIDPRSGRVQAAIPAAGAVALASGPGALWVAGGDVGTVYRIDPAINAVVARVKLDQFVCCVAVGGGYAWAMNYRVWKLSSDGRVLSSTAIDGDGANITWSSGALWVADGISGQNRRIDPLRFQPRRRAGRRHRPRLRRPARRRPRPRRADRPRRRQRDARRPRVALTDDHAVLARTGTRRHLRRAAEPAQRAGPTGMDGRPRPRGPADLRGSAHVDVQAPR